MCCSAPKEHLDIEQTTEILKKIKDPNTSTQYTSMLSALMQVMDLVEKVEQYDKESQQAIRDLVVDVNKRKRVLKERSRRSVSRQAPDSEEVVRREKFLEQRKRRNSRLRATV